MKSDAVVGKGHLAIPRVVPLAFVRWVPDVFYPLRQQVKLVVNVNPVTFIRPARACMTVGLESCCERMGWPETEWLTGRSTVLVDGCPHLG